MELTNLERAKMDSKDFWYWFLASNEIDLDTKVHIMETFSDGKVESIQSYMKDELNLDVEG